MAHDIRQWLADLGLPQYADAFEAHAIDDSVLPLLDVADLKEIGVVALGHRKRILAAIASASAAAAPPPEVEPAPQLAQKRQLTILFADLVNYTGLSQQLDAENLRSLVRAYQDTAKSSIERYGGYVAKFLGDGVLVYFGYPNSHEDDVERAIRAASELIESVAEINEAFGNDKTVSVRVRIGIETGAVIVGDVIGAGASFEHSVIGKAPNLAARAQDFAEPNHIVIGPGARALVGRNVQIEDMGAHELRGFAEPIPLWEVTGLRFAGGRFEKHDDRQLSSFIGRQAELAKLNESFHKAKAGGRTAVELAGDAGTGKSRLVHEFLRQRSATTRVLSCHCASHAGTTAFFPFIDMLRRQLGLDDFAGEPPTPDSLEAELRRYDLDSVGEIPYILNLLGLHGGDGLDPDLIGPRTEAAISRYIDNQRRIFPTILFVNDLHWIDERSESILHDLITAASPGQLMILCTYRPGYTPPWASGLEAERIELAPLPKDESVALFLDRFSEISPSMLQAAVLRAGGNPLFIEELAGHLSGTGREVANGAEKDGLLIGIPETLAGLLLERVDALSPRAQNMARIAAVAGSRFSARMIFGLDDSGEARSAFDEFRESGLIVQDGAARAERFRFKNSLVQDAIYASLLSEDRHRLHKLVGEMIEASYETRLSEFAESLARHFEIAGEPLKAARYAFMAGGKAFDLFALKDADHWFCKAVDLFPDDICKDDERRRAQAVSNHIQISCWDSRFSDMITLADEELRRIAALGDSPEVSRVISWLGEGHLNCYNFDTADRLLAQALEIGERVKNLEAIGHALAEQCWLFSITLPGDSVAKMTAHTDRVLNIAENTGNRFFMTLAHYGRWAALVHGGYIAQARMCAEALIANGRRQNYPPALNWGFSMLAYCELCEGDTASAHRHLDQARQAAQCRFDHLMTDLCLGIVNVHENDFEGAQAHLGRSQRLGDEVGSLFFAYAAEAAFGRSLSNVGKHDEAVGWLEKAYEFFTTRKHYRAAAMAGKALGDALAAARSDRTLEVLARTLKEAAACGMHGLKAETILSLHDLPGRPERASLNEAVDLASKLGWTSLNERVRHLKKMQSD